MRAMFLFIAQMHLSVKIRLRHYCVSASRQTTIPLNDDGRTTKKSRSSLMPQCLVSLCKFAVSMVCGFFVCSWSLFNWIEWVECFIQIYGSEWLEFHQYSLFLLYIIYMIERYDSEGSQESRGMTNIQKLLIEFQICLVSSYDWKVRQISIEYVNF